MKYLGIDYGKKKIGLALSEGEIAAVYKVLSVNGLKDALMQVKNVLKTEDIEEVIIGVPESGESRKLVESFVKEFKKGEDVTITEVDETLTSHISRETNILMNKKKSKRREDDATAAALILQNYLDSR